MNLIEVERIVARHGAVESRLEEGGPLGVEAPRAAEVVLADPRHAGEHRLAAVHVLHSTWHRKLFKNSSMHMFFSIFIICKWEMEWILDGNQNKIYFSILSFKTWDIFKFRTFIIL